MISVGNTETLQNVSISQVILFLFESLDFCSEKNEKQRRQPESFLELLLQTRSKMNVFEFSNYM